MNKTLHCCVLFLLFCCAVALAQSTRPAPRSLDGIVDRVQQNIEQGWGALPDFLCEERITSQELYKKKVKREAKAESIIRALRTKHEGAEDDFAESRELRLVNGKPTTNQDLEKMGLPFTLEGGFTGALGGIFGAEYRRCMDFSLGENEQLNGSTVLVLTAVAKQNTKSLGGKCASFRPGNGGRYWIEPETMQVLRAGLPNPIHSKESERLAKQFERLHWPGDIVFNWSVDFSKVLIDGKPYWLPSVARAEVASAEKPRKMVYVAEFSNYHKFGASTKILPDNGGGGE